MKKIMAILLVLIMLIPVTACGQTNEKKGVDSTVSEVQYPVTVTDHAGRTVVIEKKPERFVSCYYITSSLLIALGLDEKTVGIENNPEYRPIYALSAPAMLELPWIGTAKSVDLEACATLAPDLAILPMKVKDSADDLEALGIKVLLVNPESQELLIEMISMVAKVTDTEARGNELIEYINSKENYLIELLRGEDTPRVYIAGNSNFLSTAGSAMYQSDMICLAGGMNVAAEIEDTYWAEIDYEQLLAWNPEYIILPSSAKYTVEDIVADPVLAGCQAIVNGNVYQIPGNAESWDSPVPGSFLGAFWLTNILHPDLLTETECNEVMDEYYEKFYAFTYSEN